MLYGGIQAMRGFKKAVVGGDLPSSGCELTTPLLVKLGERLPPTDHEDELAMDHGSRIPDFCVCESVDVCPRALGWDPFLFEKLGDGLAEQERVLLKPALPVVQLPKPSRCLLRRSTTLIEQASARRLKLQENDIPGSGVGTED